MPPSGASQPVVAAVKPSSSSSSSPSPPPSVEKGQQFESRELREAKNALERLRFSRALRLATAMKKWDLLLNALREEARRCNALALELKETEKKLAVDCFRRQKECLSLLEKCIELKTSGAEPPLWSANISFPIRRVVVNTSVAEDVMAVSVLRGG
jgi:hypothetical protein